MMCEDEVFRMVLIMSGLFALCIILFALWIDISRRG